MTDHWGLMFYSHQSNVPIPVVFLTLSALCTTSTQNPPVVKSGVFSLMKFSAVETVNLSGQKKEED